MSEPGAGRVQVRICVISALLLGGLGASGLGGWLTGRMVLASVGVAFIPMAPLTALAYLAVAAALVRLRYGAGHDIPALTVGILVCGVGGARLADFLLGGGFPDVEKALIRNAGSFGSVPLGRISPVTAAALALTGTAVMLLARAPAQGRRDVAGWLGTAVTITGATVLLGYAYGTPLLYGGAVIPVALPTGIGLVLCGIAIIAVAGPAATPLRAFAESGARARLLRAFLPATTVAVLVASALGHMLVADLQANPAFAAAVSALGAAGLVGALVWRIAGRVGHAIDRAEDTLTRARGDLEAAVADRTAELARINEELEAFTSSVSHDLRAPLRHMTGFATLLERTSQDTLSEQGRNYARQITSAGARMSRLIDDLLAFARTAQTPLRTGPVDLNALVTDVIADTAADVIGRRVDWHVEPLPVVNADRALMRQVLANLIANAVKYTKTRDHARIEVGAAPGEGAEVVVYVRDNGVGFDMTYATKLFGMFQRLHEADRFEGTGIGLANVRRIIQRHGGRTWAEGAVDRGATFFIALPAHERTSVT